MMREPQRENFRDVDKSADDGVDKHEHHKNERGAKSASSTSNSIRDLISKRAGKQEKLSEKAVAHWNALKIAYDAGQRVGASSGDDTVASCVARLSSSSFLEDSHVQKSGCLRERVRLNAT